MTKTSRYRNGILAATLSLCCTVYADDGHLKTARLDAPPGPDPVPAQLATGPVPTPSAPAPDVVPAGDTPAVPEQEQHEADKLIDEAKKRAQRNADAVVSPAPLLENVIRITHIPESIKDEIRAQVRAELHADVVRDVLLQAKNEQWGVPQALPGWINKISWKGDIRMRIQSDMYAQDNAPNAYYDFLAINGKGGYGKTSVEDALINTTENRERMRMRARLAMDANVNNALKAKFRLGTGSQRDPVSTNQTLGQYSNPYQLYLDRGYLKYEGTDADRYPWLTLYGGRMENPFLTTDLVWDSDLAFEGIAATYRHNLRGNGNLLDMSERDKTLFFTVGAFPLQEVALDARDKWLFGAQLGTDLVFANQSQLNVGLAYYHFRNISGVLNKVIDGTETDFTAPLYMQKGNLVFDIRNDNNSSTDLWALAAQYHELNLTLSWDFAHFSPLHVVATADVVKNIGYDRSDIQRRTQGSLTLERSGGDQSNDILKERALGYHFAVSVGWPVVAEPGTWRIYGGFKHLERDAVVDAFTDSDFHLGGTDAEGWYIGGDYAIIGNTLISLRGISSDAIDASPFGVDTVQLDLSAKF